MPSRLVIFDDLLAHLSPLGWEHINLTGDYVGKPTVGTKKRPLRQPRLPINTDEPNLWRAMIPVPTSGPDDVRVS